MAIATLIEKIVGRQRERQEARAADFRGVVVQIADGKEPDADLVAEVLHDADKTLDDLKKAVELLQTRRELRQKLDSIPQLMAERHELEKKIAAANDDLEAAEKRHTSVVVPLQNKLHRLKEQTWAGERARGELWQTCTDEELLARLADVQARLQQVRNEAFEMRRAMEDYRMSAASERERAKHAFQDEAAERIKRAKMHEAHVDRIEKDLPAVEKTIATLEREEAAIHEQMLAP